MLKRARIWLGLAVLPALLGFTDSLGTWTSLARIFSMVCFGFFGYSLMLSLFEPADEPAFPGPVAKPADLEAHTLELPLYET